MSRTAKAEVEPDPAVAEAERAATGPEPPVADAHSEPVAEAPSDPEPVTESPSEPEPIAAEAPSASLDPERARVILDEALDTLGAAHHRPFSRG